MNNTQSGITSDDFRAYRQKLGFTNQQTAKIFLGAKDIKPSVDYGYLDELNDRLFNLIKSLNEVVHPSVAVEDLNEFAQKYIHSPFEIIKANDILPILNNQGRRPEQVYFAWMRGFIISNYFLNALEVIFSVVTDDITLVGDDDLDNIETFKRTPKADLEITIGDGSKLRIEMQSGFTGTNDIKKHKVMEAKRVLKEEGIASLAIHFDMYNGQVAFIPLSSIKEDDVNWITRQQMEGQTVFNIEQNYFVWSLVEEPVKYFDLEIG